MPGCFRQRIHLGQCPIEMVAVFNTAVMRKMIFIAGLFIYPLFLWAQPGSWKIKLNGRLLLSTTHEDETKNRRSIKTVEWEREGDLQIIYQESDLRTWKRSFLLFDETDQQHLVIDSTTYVKLDLPLLKRLFEGKKELRIYTIVAPLDPGKAVRVRRVHLFTLKLPS